MKLRLLALVLGGLAGLPGCAYTTISAPQFEAVRALFPKASPVDFEPLTWSLIWAGEVQPVVPVVVADQFVFTHRSGVEVTFNGWNVTRVAGLLGREVLTLAIGADDVLRIDAGVVKHPLDVAIGRLHQLMQPMRKLDIGIATQLAKCGGAIDRLEQRRI